MFITNQENTFFPLSFTEFTEISRARETVEVAVHAAATVWV